MSSVFAEENNYFCKEGFKSGKNYSLKILKDKIKEGIDVNQKCKRWGYTALSHIMRKIEKKEALDVLEKAGANFKYISDGGYNLIHEVAFSKSPDAIPFLIKKGLDINRKANNGMTPIMYACIKSNLNLLESFIKHGADYKYIFINKSSNYKDTCLTHALGSQPSLEFLQKIYSLDIEKKINKCSKFQYSYRRSCDSFLKIYFENLSYEPQKYDEKVLEFLIEKGSDVKKYFTLGYGEHTTPLNTVLAKPLIPKNLKIKMLNDLIKHGASVNAANFKIKYGKKTYLKSPLMIAFKYSISKDIVFVTKYLLERGANPTYEGGGNWLLEPNNILEAALIYPKLHVSHELIDILLKSGWGLSLNKKNKNDQSALSFVTSSYKRSKIKIIDFLLKKDADIFYRSKKGETLLHLAIKKFDPILIEKFLSLGLNPNARDLNGDTSLHYLLSHDGYGYNSINKYKKSLQILLKYNAKVDAKNKYNNQPIHMATWQPKPKEIFNILIKNGADINAKGRNGLTPILFASKAFCPHYDRKKLKLCAQRFTKNISFLLEKGASLNDVSYDKMNLLHHSAQRSNFSDLILYFIDKGVNYKAKDTYGNLPIDYIKKNDLLKNSKAYWKLHDLNFD